MGKNSSLLHLSLRSVLSPGLSGSYNYFARSPYSIHHTSCGVLFHYLHQRCKNSVIQPGFYVGVVEPNQEDAELGVSKQEKVKQKMVKVGS